MNDGSVTKAGELVAYVKECVVSHNANSQTEIYVRQGEDGPLQQIKKVKMFEDQRGRCIVLQISPVLLS